MNNRYTYIISFMILIFLTSCSQENIENQKITNTDEKKVDSTDKIKWNNELFLNIKNNSLESDKWVLTIDSRCIWCRKCVIIAPNHFVMNYNTRKAIVISQKNIWSKEVSSSIQRCPTKSIKIS